MEEDGEVEDGPAGDQGRRNPDPGLREVPRDGRRRDRSIANWRAATRKWRAGLLWWSSFRQVVGDRLVEPVAQVLRDLGPVVLARGEVLGTGERGGGAACGMALIDFVAPAKTLVGAPLFSHSGDGLNLLPVNDIAGPTALLEALYRAALAGADPEGRGRARVSRLRTVRRALASAPDGVGVFAVGKGAAGMFRAAIVEARAGGRGLIVLPRRLTEPRAVVTGVRCPLLVPPGAGSVERPRGARCRPLLFEIRPARSRPLPPIGRRFVAPLPCRGPGVTLAAKKRRSFSRFSYEPELRSRTLNRLRTSLSGIKGGRLGRLHASAPRHARPIGRSRRPCLARRLRANRFAAGAGDVTRVVAANRDGLAAAAREARRLGLGVRLLSGALAARGGKRAAIAGPLAPAQGANPTCAGARCSSPEGRRQSRSGRTHGKHGRPQPGARARRGDRHSRGESRTVRGPRGRLGRPGRFLPGGGGRWSTVRTLERASAPRFFDAKRVAGAARRSSRPGSFAGAFSS